MSIVQAGYRHLTKTIAPAAPIELGGSVLKWYDIAPADEPVPGPIRALARGALRGAVDSGAIALDDDLGFVILHRCGESFYFLLVSTWRNDNELWETVWAKNGDDRRLPSLAARGDAPADLLRLGARRRLARAAGVEPLPPLGPRCGRRRRRTSATPARARSSRRCRAVR